MQGKRQNEYPSLPKPAGKGETAAHAAHVRAVIAGQDALEFAQPLNLQHAASQGDAFLRSASRRNDRTLAVPLWQSHRPLEATQKPAAMVPFPRKWSTKRGRYCRFRAPGASTYGIVRARPTIF